MMAKCKTMAQEMEDILIRLRELDQLDFPQYRSYKREDGIWVDREPVPEYLEQKELIRRWEKLRLIEQYFHTAHNHMMVSLRFAYTGPRAPSARSISPTLPERSPTIPRAVLEERPCQPRRRAEPGISHRSRGWGCRWQSKQSPVIECDSGKSVIPPAWHRRFPRIPVPLHAGSSNPIQGHRGNRRD